MCCEKSCAARLVFRTPPVNLPRGGAPEVAGVSTPISNQARVRILVLTGVWTVVSCMANALKPMLTLLRKPKEVSLLLPVVKNTDNL